MSNIETLAGAASSFVGAHLHIQWENGNRGTMRYIEQGTVEGFVIHWLGGEDSVIAFYVSGFRRELHLPGASMVEQLTVPDMEDTPIEFRMSSIRKVERMGRITEIYMNDNCSMHGPFNGSMQVLLSPS